MRPLHTLLSALVVAVALGVLVWAAESRAAVRRCRRSHPAACLAAVLAVGLLVLWAVGGACTFLFSIAGPVLRESPLPGDTREQGQRVRVAPGRPCPGSWGRRGGWETQRAWPHPFTKHLPWLCPPLRGTTLNTAFPGLLVLSAFHQPRPGYRQPSPGHSPVTKCSSATVSGSEVSCPLTILLA